MVIKKYIKLTFILALSLIMGCGYTAGSLLPSRLKTIYVESFVNKIDISREPSDRERYKLYKSGLETDITRAVIDQFIFDGHLSIVDEEDANLVLRGDLVYYTKEAITYDQSDNVEEYRMLISVDMELLDVTTGKLMWKEAGFTGETTYQTTGRLSKNEETSVKEAVKDLAERIVEKTTEGW